MAQIAFSFSIWQHDWQILTTPSGLNGEWNIIFKETEKNDLKQVLVYAELAGENYWRSFVLKLTIKNALKRYKDAS
jgi:hypothetical protein